MALVSLKAAIEIIGDASVEKFTREIPYTEVVYSKIDVAASGTHTADFGVVTTATFVFIRTNSGLTYTHNGGSETMVINAGGWQILLNDSITGLVFTETDAAAMKLELILAGV